MALVLLLPSVLAISLNAEAPDKSGVGPTAISLPSGPGSIEGLGESFEPQLNSGSSTYSVGIEVAPGRVGFQPGLTLSYNSGLGNSFVGVGWTLGIPEIKRQTDKGFPAYDSRIDTFLFQGEELVPLTDGFYRCENETGFQRFQPIDSDNDGQLEAWEMVERNGVRHRFGRFRGESNRWSAVEHPKPPPAVVGRPMDTTYCWMLDTSTDLHGNRIEYEYELGVGKLYPIRITYSHSDAGSQEVLFEYEERPDVFDDYRPTFSCRIDRRLKEVVVRSLGDLVRRYELDYRHQPEDLIPYTIDEQQARTSAYELGVSVLKRFTQFDNSGTYDNYLPPLRFYYSFLDGNLERTQTQSVQTSLGAVPLLDLADTSGHVQLADVNADGLPDLFSTKPQGLVGLQQVMLNQGVGADGRLRFSDPILASESSTLNLSLPQSALSDRDGDGIVDYEVVTDEFTGKRIDIYSNRSRFDRVNASRLGFAPLLASRSEFIAGAPSYVGAGAVNTRRMDLNFDKASDYLHTSSDFVGLTLRGFYRNPAGDWKEFVNSLNGIPSTHTLDRPVSGDDNLLVTLADMNGDRMQDYVAVERLGGISATLKVTYWPYCALGEWAESRSIETAIEHPIEFGGGDMRDVLVQDFTGDGLADLLILDGSGFASSLTLRANVAGHAWAAPLKKSGLPVYRPRDTTAPTVFRTADLNGNGSTDLIWRNTGFGGDTWEWLDLMPQAGKPNLMTRIDNSIGKITDIVYGNAHEDYIRAQDAGHPWTTTIPFSVQVVRQIRTQNGYDLNGDQLKDVYVSEFKYRDGYYDGFEKEFRGFAFAERIDYGDDFIWDPASGVIQVSEGWNRGKTPTGQVHGPTLVTRYRFHTGSADGVDNDESAFGSELIDEYTSVGGREEEPLKGKQLLEEKIDPWILHNGDVLNGFDAVCSHAALSGNLYASLTANDYVYSRARQHWGVRRLYRPAEEVELWAERGGEVPLHLGALFQVPAARFANSSVRNGTGKDVSFAFVEKIETDVIEANALLHEALNYQERAPKHTRQDFDYDNYGNQILSFNHGIVDEDYDDERRVVTSYAHSGNALTRWILDKPDTVLTTDEDGAFVNKTVHHYDGMPFVGLNGAISDRALLHRVEKFINETESIDAERSQYDPYGNPIELRDPNYGTEFGLSGGHYRKFEYDATLQTYPVAEIIGVAHDKPDLVTGAEYNLGFGIVQKSSDFNENATIYQYDSFARLVGIVKPYDSEAFPTTLYEYRPYDIERSMAYTYGRQGRLSLQQGGIAANRVLTHAREEAGGDVYTSGTLTDGAGKSIASYGEDVDSGRWVVSSASSYNLRGGNASGWLPFQVRADGDPSLNEIWPTGRPPLTDGINPSIVKSDQFSDPLGRGIKTVQPTEQWGGERVYSAKQMYPFEIRNFDENDTDPDSPFVDTPLVHFEDGLSRLVRVHEVVRLTDAGEPGALSAWETSYAYDLNDKLERILDSQDNLKVLAHDGLGRLTYMDDPDRGVMHYVYDAASNLIETTDAKAQIIRNTYDGVNRIRTEDYLDEGAPYSANYAFDPNLPISNENRADVVYFYDFSIPDLEIGDGTLDEGSNSSAQLCYVWDLTGEEHFSYDDRGRIEWQVKRIPDIKLKNVLVSWQTRYAYDSLDRVARLTYPDGDRIRNVYNARTLLEHVTGGPSGFIIQNIDYLPSAQLSEITYGNGVVTHYQYDPRLRLRDLDTESPIAGKLIDYAYTFDRANNITRIDDARDLEGQPDAAQRRNTQVFRYDDLYRLTQVKYPSVGERAAEMNVSTPGIDYRYDRIGNMLRKTSNIEHRENGLSVTHLGEMSYGGDLGASGRDGRGNSPAGPHALSGVSADGGRIYPYDANGNMVEIDGLHCSWDFKDRMVGAENSGMSAQYRYDYTDRRIIKKVGQVGPHGKSASLGGETTQYINRYFELRPKDPPVKYVWAGDTRVARITGSLDEEGPKIQRLRLWKGWNLVSLNLDGTNSILGHTRDGAVNYAAIWNVDGELWETLGERIQIGNNPLWLETIEDRVIGVIGDSVNQKPIELKAGEAGWIAIGEDLKSDFLGLLKRVRFWGWDASVPEWKIWTEGLEKSRSDGEMHRGLGVVYYVYNSSDGTIFFELGSDMRISYYHQNHLGSTCAITDQSGELREEMLDYPFGKSRNPKEFNLREETYGFSQKENDGESGLHYFEARYFCSVTGRFTSVDPHWGRRIWRDGDFANVPDALRRNANIYGYAGGNPIANIDPSGEFLVPLIPTIIGIGIGVLAYEPVAKALSAIGRAGSETIEYGWKGAKAGYQNREHGVGKFLNGVAGAVIGAGAGLVNSERIKKQIETSLERSKTSSKSSGNDGADEVIELGIKGTSTGIDNMKTKNLGRKMYNARSFKEEVDSKGHAERDEAISELSEDLEEL